MRRRGLIAVGLAGALAAGGCGVGAQRFGDGDPRQAVSDLISVTVGQASGAKACAMLADSARTQLDRGPAGSCDAAISNAAPFVPGVRDDATDNAISITNLRFSDRVRGSRATVHVTGGGADMTFGLVRLAQGGAGTPLSPATPWRVERGVEQLLGNHPRPPAPSQTGTTGATPPKL